jgi:hypothetical protein
MFGPAERGKVSGGRLLSHHPNLVADAARHRFLDHARVRWWPEEKLDALGDHRVELDRSAAVLEALAGRPLELYRELRADAWERHSTGPQASTAFGGVPINAKCVLRRRELPGLDPTIRALCDEVGGWAEPWHLSAEWVFEIALHTLARWCESPRALERRHWAPTNYAFALPQQAYTFSPWFGDEDFSEYKQRTRDQVKRDLDRYFRAIEKEAAAAGLPVKTVKSQSHAYQWAVRAQILGDPISRIAVDYGVNQHAVAGSVERLIEFLGLPPRPRKRGRPAGARDRHRSRSS